VSGPTDGSKHRLKCQGKVGKRGGGAQGLRQSGRSRGGKRRERMRVSKSNSTKLRLWRCIVH